MCRAYLRAALFNFSGSSPCAALNRGRRLFEGGAYSSKCGTTDSLALVVFRVLCFSDSRISESGFRGCCGSPVLVLFYDLLAINKDSSKVSKSLILLP